MNRSRYIEGRSSPQPIDMTVIGIKESMAQDTRKGRNLNEMLQRSQVIKQTTVNFPLNLPIQTINMSMQNSPVASDVRKA